MVQPRIFKQKYFLLILSVLLFIVGNIKNSSSDNYSSTIKEFEKKLHEKEKVVQNELSLISSSTINTSNTFIANQKHYSELSEKEGITLLLFEKNELIFWTDHTIAPIDNLQTLKNKNIIKLYNGWYECIKSECKNNEQYCIGLLLIKNEYDIQNQYLVNHFNPALYLAPSTKILEFPTSSSFSVLNNNDHFLFALEFDKQQINSTTFWFKIFTNCMAILLLLASLQQIVLQYKEITSVTLLFGIVLLIRYLSIKTKFPEIFYDSYFFNPQLYGDAKIVWLSSLGDFFINALLLLFIGNYIRKNIHFKSHAESFSKPIKQLSVFSIIISIFYLSRIINYLISGLVTNSNISFNINDIFSLGIYSYIAFIAIAIVLLSFYFISEKAIEIINSLKLNARELLITFAIGICSVSLISHQLGELDEIQFLWSTILLFIIYFNKQFILIRNTFTGAVIVLLMLSLYTTHLFLKYSGSKERSAREVLIEKISTGQDPIAEQLFSETQNKIQADSILHNTLNTTDSLTVKNKEQLIQKYFKGYWTKYDIKISLLHTNEKPTDTIGSEIKKTPSIQNKLLYYINDKTGIVKFEGYIPLKTNKTDNRLLFIEFNPKSFSEKIGFPELLTDNDNLIYEKIKNYSFAKYQQNKLVSFYGNYSYPTVINEFINVNFNRIEFFENEGYGHLIYKNSTNDFVVLSLKVTNTLEQITTFSFLFSFNSLLVLILLIGYQLFSDNTNQPFLLKNKIQYLLISIIFSSTLLFSVASVWYINRQYTDSNKRNIREKIFSVKEELEKQTILNSDTEYNIQNLSNLFSTDITIYNTQGNLITSSIPKIFEKGYLSNKMCSDAYTQLNSFKKQDYIDTEKIGSLTYLSAYVPLRIENGELIGFLNLPYFSKQNTLEHEIGYFISAIINIYVLLFLLSSIIAIFIANYMTRPLSIIEQKIRKIKLGKANEIIDWNTNDEIGNLVHEYNRMINELAVSANLLAKSERESAWREMAKQVAHEIKNPLTPMKLHIQHYQKTWKDYGVDMESKTKRFTDMLIEQIEVLTTIANEFSNYAKMPKANYNKVDMVEVIKNAIELQKGLGESEITLHSHLISEAIVLADKEQLLRVFNNIIKNALQAIPENRKAEINVYLKRQNQFYLIEFKDNGTGILQNQMDKIFAPNFTTKTSGMGLGLAMCKTIIEGFDGKISFNTIEGEGTSFFISLPMLE